MESLLAVRGWVLGRNHNPGQTLEGCASGQLTCCQVTLCHPCHPPCWCLLLSSSVIILSLGITISLGTGTILCNASLSTNAITLWVITNNSSQRYIGCGRSCFLPAQLSKSIAREIDRGLSILEQFFVKTNISLICVRKILLYICFFLLAEILKVWLCEFCSCRPGHSARVLSPSTHISKVCLQRVSAQAQGQAALFISPGEDQTCDTSALPLFLTGIFIVKLCSVSTGI